MAAGKLKVALIGAGSHSTGAHMPSLARMDDIDFAAICDVDITRCRKAVEDFGARKAYADYREMLDSVKPNAVLVCLQPEVAFPIATDILTRGIPLFIEKPPGITAFQATALAETAQRSGVVSFAGFNRRYAPALVEARKRVEAAGPLDHFVVTFSKFGGPAKVPYYSGVASVLVFDAIHAVDTLRWLGGEPEAVAAVVRESSSDQNVKYVALARFPEGRTGFLNCTWDSGVRTLRAELHGGCSVAYVEIERGFRFHEKGGPAVDVTAAQLAGDDSPPVIGGYYQEDRAFIECVRFERNPANDLADAARTMALAEKLYISGF